MASAIDELPKTGERLEVYVTHVKVNRELGQVNFWAQLDPEGAELLEELDVVIQEKASSDPHPPEPKNLLVGEPCLANFIEDSRWYRARVEQCTENDVIAYFMDYGNTEIIPFNLIRRADSSVFAQLRAQATECILEGVKVNTAKPEATSYLKKLLEENSFIGKPAGVIAGRVHMTLQMDTESREIVAERIIREDFGYPMKAQLQSSRGCIGEGGDNSIQFKRMGLEVGSREKLFISHIDSPSSFWIQQSSISLDLDNLMSDLMNFYSEGSGVENVRRVEDGMPCVALYSFDEFFYRAVVEKVLANKQCRILYVDYGNSEVVSVDKLKIITEEFLKLPTIAIKCCLSGIEEASCKTKEATARFDELAGDKELCGKVVGFNGDRCAILLVDPNGKENADIAGVLVKEELAKRDKEQFPVKGTRRVPDKTERASPVSSTPSSGSVLQQPHHHGRLRADEGRESREPQRPTSFTVQSLRPGSKHQVQVTSVASVANISCQLLKDTDAFDVMMANLQETYASPSSDTRINAPVVNQPCCVQFTEDDLWYRAKVTAIKGSTVDVTYVDYGNSEIISVSRLRILQSKFFELPLQCLSCSLDGISPEEGNRAKTQDYFEDITSDKDLIATIIGNKNDIHIVVLTEASTGVSINKEIRKFLQPVIKTPPRNQPAVKTPPRNQSFHNSQPSRTPPKGHQQQSFQQKTLSRDQSQQTVKSPPRSEPQFNHERPAKIKQASSPGRVSEPTGIATFTEVQLPNGQTPVYLAHGNNPSEIWCQPVKSAAELEALMETVYNKYTSQSVPTLKNMAVGMPCVALFSEDEGWYRAVVVNKHVGELEVLFVDYGNTERVAMAKVKQISPDLMKLPAQAVKCCLKGWDLGNAEPKVIDKMKDLSANVDQFKCESLGSSSGVYEVELSWNALKMSQELKKIQMQALKEKKLTEKTTASVASVKASTSQPVVGHISSILDDINVSAHEDFIVSHVDNPTRFWCQRAKDCEALDTMMVKINDIYHSSSGDALDLVSVGCFCVAKYTDDDGWYRAQILKTIFVSQVEVHYIDYGNTSNVDISDLRKLRPEFCALKSQAILCALDGHTCICDDYQQDIIDKFKELTLEKQLVGDVKAKGAGMITLELFDTTGVQDININRSMNEGQERQSSQVIVCGYPQRPKLEDGEVYVSHIEGVQQFFVQMSNQTEEIETMSAQLQDAYCAVGSSQLQLTESNIGQVCCAQFTEDQQWYRAIITDTPTPGRAKVCFVDFGNSEEQDVGKLKAVKSEFRKQPALAIECRLGECRRNVPETLKKFETIVLDKPLVCSFHGNSSAPFGVTLMDGDVNINREMSSVVGSLATQTATDNDDPLKKMAHKPEESKTSTWTGKTFPQEKLKESFQDVNVIKVDSPDKFFVQQLHFLGLVEDLEREINSFTEGILSNLVLPDWLLSAEIGMPCLAKSREDNKWCRAEVLQVFHKSGEVHVDVTLVDWGVQQTVGKSELLPINATLVNMPVLLEQCKLQSVIPMNGASDWNDMVCNAFSEMTLGHKLEIIVEDDGVDLYTENKKSIRTTLIEMGLVQDPNIVPAEEELEELSKEDTQKDAAEYIDAIETKEQLVLYFLVAKGTTEIVCQPASSADSLQELMDNLHAHYEEESNQIQVTPEIGQQCVARFTEDDGWYRAEVQAIEDNNITVHYIDYGNLEVFGQDCICKMEPQFAELPAQAITYQVQPPLMHQSQWNDDVKKLLEESCAERELQVTLIEASGDVPVIKLSNEDTYFILTSLSGIMPPVVEAVAALELCEVVTLIFLSAEGPATITCQPASTADDLAKLMDNLADYFEDESHQVAVTPKVGEQCVAMFTEDDGWYRAEVEAIQDSNITVHYIDYGNSEVLSQDRMCKMQPQFAELPPQAITYQVKPPLMHQSQWNDEVKAIFEESCAERELQVTVTEVSGDVPVIRLSNEDTRFILTALVDIMHPVVEAVAAPELGEELTLIFLSAAGPATITCQPASTADDLAELMDNLAAYYDDESQQVAFTPEVGASCVAKFTDDESWYRATAVAVNDNDITVQYIDFGNTEIVTQDQVREMKPEFEELVAQAVTYQVKPPLMNQSQWNEDVKATLEENCAESIIKAYLVKTPDCSLVVQLSKEDVDFIQASLSDVFSHFAKEDVFQDEIDKVADTLAKTAISVAIEEMTVPENIQQAAGVTVMTLFDKVTHCLLLDELKKDEIADAHVENVHEDTNKKEVEIEIVKNLVEDVISKALEKVCSEVEVDKQVDSQDTNDHTEIVTHEILDEIIESVVENLHIGSATEALQGHTNDLGLEMEHNMELKSEHEEIGFLDEQYSNIAEPDISAVANEEANVQNMESHQVDEFKENLSDYIQDLNKMAHLEPGDIDNLTNEEHPNSQRKRHKSGEGLPGMEHTDDTNRDSIGGEGEDDSPESKKPKMKESNSNQCIVSSDDEDDKGEVELDDSEKSSKEEDEYKYEEDNFENTADVETVEEFTNNDDDMVDARLEEPVGNAKTSSSETQMDECEDVINTTDDEDDNSSSRPKMAETNSDQCIIGNKADREGDEREVEMNDNVQRSKDEEKYKYEEVEDDFEDAEDTVGDEAVEEVPNNDEPEHDEVDARLEGTVGDAKTSGSETQMDECEDATNPTAVKNDYFCPKQPTDEMDQEESFESAPSSPERDSAETPDEMSHTKAEGIAVNDEAEQISEPVDNNAVNDDALQG